MMICFLLYQINPTAINKFNSSFKTKNQEGDYWDTFLRLNFDLDKRNQKFKTSKGYRSIYNTEIPLISDSYTFQIIILINILQNFT